MNSFWLDLRVAVRTLLKRPGFLAVAVSTLGLGVGANTAIFSVVNAVLLRPLPYPGGDQIVRIIQNRPSTAQPGGFPARLAALSTDDLQAWRDRSQTLSQMAAYGPAPVTLTGRDEAARLAGARVSPALFPLLGVAPLKGRTFAPGEEASGADAVTVLSFTAWQKYFAADPDILTRTLLLDGRAYTVVGVMPQGFEFPDPQTEVWLPFVLTPPVRTPGERMIQIVQVIARVKDGVALETATAEANVIFRQLRADEARLDAEQTPDGPAQASPPGVAGGQRGGPFIRGGGPTVMRGGSPSGGEGPAILRRGGPGPDGPAKGGPFGAPGVATIELSRLKEELVRPVRAALLVLLVAVGFVLLIACANVANLLLARAAGRQKEIAVRAALGATRGRLVRQVLTESGALALVGSLFGTAIAWAGVQALGVLGPADIPRLGDVHIDLPVFAFTVGVSLLTAAIFGAMPAFRMSRVDEMLAIKQGASAASSGLKLFGRHRTRSVLATGEIGLAMILLVGAGLLINSFRTLANVNPGYDPKNVLTFQVALPETRYSADQRRAFYEQMLERLGTMPGVRAAALSNTLPLQQGIVRIGVNLQGRPGPIRPEDFTAADVRVVSADYLTAMGIRLVDGRPLNPKAREGQPHEVLVNESFVRRYLAGDRAIGARMNLSGPEPWEIVGVVHDVRHAGLTADPLPELYVDFRQVASVMPRGLRDAFFTVRTTGAPLSLASSVRDIVHQYDGELVVDNLATMDQRLSTSVARPRFYATLVGAFAVIALVLAAVGIYGVLAYAVSQCTREIGIRIALGASKRRVLGLVLRQGALIAAIGMAMGLSGAAVMTRSLTTLLFGLTPFDPATFAAAAVLLAVVALLACAVPAWRAMSVDPIVALREE